MSLESKACDINKSFVIALDGPAASGKGTIGRMLAEKFSLKYLQSSIIYRQLAFYCLVNRIDIEDSEAVIGISKLLNTKNDMPSSSSSELIVDVYDIEGARSVVVPHEYGGVNSVFDPNINNINNVIDLESEEVGSIASKISVIAEVRKNINVYLCSVINATNRILVEGRDIGTVVVPNADLKIFIDADINIRARRRYNQLQQKGKNCILAEVLQQLVLRDQRDREREVGPLSCASDALLIDTSDHLPIEVVEKVAQHIFRSCKG